MSAKIHEKAKAMGINLDATDLEAKVVDDGNPERIFSFKYKPYLQPADQDSVEETKKADDENQKRYAFNQTQESVIKVVMARLGQSNWKLVKPGTFNERAVELWGRKIREPSFMTLAAVELLAKRGKFPIKDYPMDKACDLAEETVIADFLTTQRQKPASYRVDINAFLPKDHLTRCNCCGTWDGKSKTCAGSLPSAQKASVTWRTAEDFHFLAPVFEVYVPPDGALAGAGEP